MPMTTLLPSLMVADVNRSVAFYRDVLGFTFLRGVSERTRTPVTAWPASEPLAWALLANGGARLALKTRSFLSATVPRLANARIGGSLMLDMQCDNLDAVCGHIGEHAPFLKAIHVTDQGQRQCSIEDPDGYILTFTEGGQPPAQTPETAS